MALALRKIISGGQTGADEAGLWAGRALGLETGGTAPQGWRIQMYDGSEGSNSALSDYGLVEHESREYPPRTRQNVQDADGTLWVGYAESSGGALTIATAKDLGKCIIVNPTAAELRKWAIANQIGVLNVAGNRFSPYNPVIRQITYSLLISAFKERNDGRIYQ